MKSLPTLNSSAASRGYLIAIIGTAIWSTTAIFIRYLNEAFAMPPMVVAFWRDFLVALSLLLFFLLANRRLLRLEQRHAAFMLGYGLTLALFNAFWTVSVKLNGAAISTVLIYSSAAFTALYERLFLHASLGWRKSAAIFLSLAGCVFVSGVYDPDLWQLNPWGILVGLLSGVGFTSYSLLGKKVTERGLNTWTALLYSFIVAAGFLLLLNAFPDGSARQPFFAHLLWLGDAWWGWLVLLLLAIGPSIGGYGLYNLSLSYLPASISNLIATLEPSMTALLAYLFLRERFTPAQILGSLLILAGVITLRLREILRRRKKGTP